jgi:hypothetical protein
VKLDPADIPKAMWCEVDPAGELLWTSSGQDLIAYRTADISLANAAPSGPMIKPVRRLTGAVPPSGITGATFVDDRLYVAGADDSTYQVWSIDLATGARQLEIERQVFGESEGLAYVEALGGVLHWIITPVDSKGRPPTYGGNVLITFKARKGVRPTPVATITASKTTVKAGKRTKLTFTVKRTVGTLTLPAAGAKVSFAGKTLTTDGKGRATTTVTLTKSTAASVRVPSAKTAKVTVKVVAR